MNVIFMGTPEFAVPALRFLARSSHKIIAVITQPDRPKGRNKKLCASPVKETAVKLGLDILQPVNVNDEDVIKQLKRLLPDCIAVVAFGQLLSDSLINLPRYQCINIHSSLLPKYRGAAPINWAIIRGETVTGVTSMVMVKKMDAGDIIKQITTPIFPEENAGELEERLATFGAELLVETLDHIETGNATYTKQNEEQVTFAPKLKKEDGLIRWSQETNKIHNLIRGITPTPGAYTFYKKQDSDETKRVIIRKTNIHNSVKKETSYEPGTIVEIAPCGIHVTTRDGVLCIAQLQPEGKKAMNAQDYIRGHTINVSDKFVSNL